MTPEERAWEINITGSACEDLDQSNEMRSEIAGAIRAAENDALERAALRVAKFLGDFGIISPIIEVIRSLKHKESV
jgi:hypothetical protein